MKFSKKQERQKLRLNGESICLPLSWKEEKRMCQLETELKDVLVEMAAVKGAEEALKRMEDI